jgi:hypothetical protein
LIAFGDVDLEAAAKIAVGGRASCHRSPEAEDGRAPEAAERPDPRAWPGRQDTPGRWRRSRSGNAAIGQQTRPRRVRRKGGAASAAAAPLPREPAGSPSRFRQDRPRETWRPGATGGMPSTLQRRISTAPSCGAETSASAASGAPGAPPARAATAVPEQPPHRAPTPRAARLSGRCLACAPAMRP